MKSFFKNCGLAVKLPVLLLAAGLLVMFAVTCSGPDTGYNQSNGAGVRLNFVENPNASARTVLPLPADWALTGFTYYNVVFTGTGVTPGTTANFSFAEATRAAVLAPFELDDGDYTLEVLAFKGGSPSATTFDPANPTGTGNGTGTGGDLIGRFDYAGTITVAGANSPASPSTETIAVIFSAIEDDGWGTFTWSIEPTIDTEGTVISATVSVYPIGTPTTLADTLDVNGDPDGTATLNDASKLATTWTVGAPGFRLAAGYYYVDVVIGMEDDESNAETFTSRHILHIYRALNSNFEYEFKWKKAVPATIVFVRGTVTLTPWNVDPIGEGIFLTVDGTNQAEKYQVDLDKIQGQSAVVDVRNIATFDVGTITWRLNAGNAVTTPNGVIDTASPLLIDTTHTLYVGLDGVYTLTVEGLKGGVPYSTYIYVRLFNSTGTRMSTFNPGALGSNAYTINDPSDLGSFGGIASATYIQVVLDTKLAAADTAVVSYVVTDDGVAGPSVDVDAAKVGYSVNIPCADIMSAVSTTLDDVTITAAGTANIIGIYFVTP